jgi:hypothetical protein
MRYCLACAALALGPVAHATPPLPPAGPADARLALGAQEVQLLASGSRKVGDALAASLTFALPADTSCVVRLSWAPIAGRVDVPGWSLLTEQGDANVEPKDAALLVNDSGLGPAGGVAQKSCGALQVGSRVTVPLTFTPSPKPGSGSAVNVRVEVFGGKGIDSGSSSATLVLASDPSGKLSISTANALDEAQRQRLATDPDFRISQQFATDTLPLDVSTVPAARSTRILDFAADAGGAR